LKLAYEICTNGMLGKKTPTGCRQASTEVVKDKEKVIWELVKGGHELKGFVTNWRNYSHVEDPAPVRRPFHFGGQGLGSKHGWLGEHSNSQRFSCMKKGLKEREEGTKSILILQSVGSIGEGVRGLVLRGKDWGGHTP